MAQVKTHTRKTKKGSVRVRPHNRNPKKKPISKLDRIEKIVDARLEKFENKLLGIFRDIDRTENKIEKKLDALDSRVKKVEVK